MMPPLTSRPRHPAPASRPGPRRRWPWLAAAVVAICLIVAALEFTNFDWTSIRRTLVALDSATCIVLMCLLPVGGFSVGIIYLVAGAKWGPWVGGAVIAGATAVHLVLSHLVARSFLRARFERFLARRDYHLPDIPRHEEGAVSALAALVPGVPYAIRNYLLALSGIALRTYFFICLPIYVIRSYVTIMLGDMSGQPSRIRFLVLGAVYLVKLGICALLIRWLMKRHRKT